MYYLCEKYYKPITGKVTQSCPTLCDPRTIEFMEFSRPEYWSGYPFLSTGDLPIPGIEPRSPALQAVPLLCEPLGKPHKIWKCFTNLYVILVQGP